MTSISGRRVLALVALLFSMGLINYLDRVVLSVSASPIMEEFGIDAVGFGWLSSAFLWTYAICLIPAGIVTDRFGARKTLSIGIAVWSAATMLTGIIVSLGALFATRFLMGAGEAASGPAANKMIGRFVPGERRGIATAAYNMGGYAGPAFGAALFSWIITALSWHWAFVFAGLIGFAWLVPWLTWFRRHGDLTVDDSGSGGSDDDSGPLPLGLKGLLAQPSMWGIAITQGCGVYSQYLFLTWLPSYLHEAKGLAIAQSGLFTAIPYLGAVVLGILLGRLSDRMLSKGGVREGQRRRMIGAMLLVSAVVLFIPLVDDLWMVLVLLTISLTGVSSAITFCIALINDLLGSQKDSGRASSIAFVAGNVFGLTAPIITGYLVASSAGYSGAFILAGVILVIGTLLSQVGTRRRIERRPLVQELVR